MDYSCEACSAGPVGISGHANLWVRSLNSREMIFRCERCEAMWARSSPASGEYVWAIMNERAAMRRVGVTVPPRSEPLALFAWRSVGPVAAIGDGRPT